MSRDVQWSVRLLLPIAVVGGGPHYWREESRSQLPDGTVRANGCIEAEQLELATKMAGLLAEVLVADGDIVHKGNVVAHMEVTQIAAGLSAIRLNWIWCGRAIAQARNGFDPGTDIVSSLDSEGRRDCRPAGPIPGILPWSIRNRSRYRLRW